MLGFEEVVELKVGDIIYECEAGTNIGVRVLEVPTITEEGSRQARWTAEVVSDSGGSWKAGETIDYLCTERYMHYGPKLYRHKEYSEN